MRACVCASLAYTTITSSLQRSSETVARTHERETLERGTRVIRSFLPRRRNTFCDAYNYTKTKKEAKRQTASKRGRGIKNVEFDTVANYGPRDEQFRRLRCDRKKHCRKAEDAVAAKSVGFSSKSVTQVTNKKKGGMYKTQRQQPDNASTSNDERQQDAPKLSITRRERSAAPPWPPPSPLHDFAEKGWRADGEREG